MEAGEKGCFFVVPRKNISLLKRLWVFLIGIHAQAVIGDIHNRNQQFFHSGEQMTHLIGEVGEADLLDSRAETCHFTAILNAPMKLSPGLSDCIMNASFVHQSLVQQIKVGFKSVKASGQYSEELGRFPYFLRLCLPKAMKVAVSESSLWRISFFQGKAGFGLTVGA